MRSHDSRVHRSLITRRGILILVALAGLICGIEISQPIARLRGMTVPLGHGLNAVTVSTGSGRSILSLIEHYDDNQLTDDLPKDPDQYAALLNATGAADRVLDQPVRTGLMVSKLPPMSPLAKTGLRAKDVVVPKGTNEFTSGESMRQVLVAGGDVVVYRGRSTKYDLRIPPGVFGEDVSATAVSSVAPPSGERIPVALADSVGGSSGLALALRMIDSRTKGSLVGDGHIVVTGALDSSGGVVGVGEVPTKHATAGFSGAKFMLVPTDNRSEVVGLRGVPVEMVSSVDDAIGVLCSYTLGQNAPNGDGVCSTPRIRYAQSVREAALARY